ncbi:MAG: hypothetical protein WD009_08075 [Phycisphaeraceae bacterium]
MDRIHLLIISPDPLVGGFFTTHLSAARYAVEAVRPGPDTTARVCRPPVDVAVIDRIDQRPDAAHAEIALLKQSHPQARVIAMSRDSSANDAGIVEQGLFYYWTGKPRTPLLQIIEAAAGRTGKEERA